MTRSKRFVTAVICALGVAATIMPAGRALATDAQNLRFYEEQIKPLLEANCFKCHGGEKTKGSLTLTNRASILAGGDTGPAVSLDQPSKSLLLKAISYTDPDLQMPKKQKLPDTQIALLTKWVEMGIPMSAGGPASRPVVTDAHPKRVPPQVNAETMKFWSFQP